MRGSSPGLTGLFSASRGRPAAAVILILFAILICFPEQSPFKSMRLFLFDRYQSWLPRERATAPVTIVGIDEASLKVMGQWPWPRTKMAELIDRINRNKPAAIGLDIIMPESDRYSPANLAKSLRQIGPALQQRLMTLPDNDRLLANVLAQTPVVLGAAGFEAPTATTTSSMRTAPIVQQGGEAASFVKHYPAVLKSLPILEDAASGQALLNGNLENGIVRRIPLVSRVGDVLAPSLSLEMLRVALGLPTISVEVGPRGIGSVHLGDIRIPTQPDGEVWVHFAPFLPDRYVSAADVISGRINPELIEQKLVLIALTGQGLVDIVTNSRGERIPGVEVHAQFLENIFDRSFLTRPPWLPGIELAILLVSGMMMIRDVPKMKPKLSTFLAIALITVFLASGFILYQTTGLLLDAASLSLGVGACFICLIISSLIITDRKRHAAERALQLEREEAARVVGEMEAAKRIQMGSLPRAETLFSGETRFDLSALLEPARIVGGDLYDFYMLDENRLFLIVADVAGKGLPASLFMVATKAIAKSIALQNRMNVREIFERMNRELAADNPEMLFVTAFAAILDVEQGALEYCLAGHDAPWRISAGGNVERLEGEGHPGLCMVEDVSYSLEKTILSPGDVLCAVTDGVTEAMNKAGELYGTKRVTDVLEREGTRIASAAELLKKLRNDVNTHVGQAEQSDDLTMLVIRWKGAGALE